VSNCFFFKRFHQNEQGHLIHLADFLSIPDSFFQPTAQAYPTVNNGATFPDSHGVAVGIPLASNDVSFCG
jgi:hypothetical protein